MRADVEDDASDLIGQPWAALVRLVRLSCVDAEPDAIAVDLAALRRFAAADVTGVGVGVMRCCDAAAALARTHELSDRLAFSVALKDLATRRSTE